MPSRAAREAQIPKRHRTSRIRLIVGRSGQSGAPAAALLHDVADEAHGAEDEEDAQQETSARLPRDGSPISRWVHRNTAPQQNCSVCRSFAGQEFASEPCRIDALGWHCLTCLPMKTILQFQERPFDAEVKNGR